VHGPLIVTVYTEGTPYADDASELASSASAFGHEVRRIAMPDAGDWYANVAGKPQVLYDAMCGHDGPVLFLDADCRLVGPLNGIEAMLDRCDLAAVSRPDHCFTGSINSGVVLFNATDAARSVAREWAQRARRYARFHRFGDQGALGEALALARPRARFEPLPPGWNADAVDGKPPPSCTIVHHKRSRSARKGLEPPGDGATATSAAENVRLIMLRPDPKLCEAGTYVQGVVAMGTDLVESARRYGFAFSEMMAFHARGGATGIGGGEVLTAMYYACGRSHCAAPLLLAHDSILVRDPAPICARLEHADIVLAWDAERAEALPAPGVIAMRADADLCATLLPRLREALPEFGDDVGLARSLAAVLSDPPEGIRVATLPRATVATADEADEQTIVMQVRRQPAAAGDRVPED
jgi:hypothetical protein